MKTYYLTINNNMKDVLSKVSTDSLEQAILYFSGIKKLAPEDLLKVYTISE